MVLRQHDWSVANNYELIELPIAMRRKLQHVAHDEAGLASHHRDAMSKFAAS